MFQRCQITWRSSYLKKVTFTNVKSIVLNKLTSQIIQAARRSSATSRFERVNDWRRGCRAHQQAENSIHLKYWQKTIKVRMDCFPSPAAEQDEEMQRGRRRKKTNRTELWRGGLWAERERERGYCLFSCSSHLRHCGDAESAQLAPNTWNFSKPESHQEKKASV